MTAYAVPTLSPDLAADRPPRPVPGAMRDCRSHPAKPSHQEPLGFPGELVDGWQEVAVARLGELVARYQSLQVFLDICVKCGACHDKCHYFLGTADPYNMPVARQDLLRSVFRHHYTTAGKWLGNLAGARPLTEDVLDEWYNYFHQCSQCRRCSVFCPYGIDTAEISMAARDIMDVIGKGQKYTNEVITKVHDKGNNLGLSAAALRNTLEGLEEDVLEDTGVPVKFPLDVKGADVLLVTPSADFFAEPHVDGLIGYAKIFHQAGINWTISSHASEAANFALFIGSYDQMHKVASRIREAALDLGVKRLVFGECGHAWRVAYSFLNTFAGPWDFLDPRYPVPQHIIEVTHDLVSRGAVKLDRDANAGVVATMHDSCNVARAARLGDRPGGQFSLPRELLAACVPTFVEMHPSTVKDKTFCCGGGGGLLTDELMDLRIKGTKPRAEALRQVVEDDGVTHMVAMCAICKSQFTAVLPHYGFEMEMVVSLHQLIGKALRLGAGA